MQNEEINNADYSAPLIKQLNELSETPPAPVVPTPDNPPWNSGTAFGVWIASFIFIAVVPLFFILPYAFSKNVNFADAPALTKFLLDDPTAVLLQVLATIPAHVFTVLLGWLVVTRFRKFSFRETLGWQNGGLKWWHYPLILLGIFAVSALVSQFFPQQDNDMQRILRSSQAAVFAVAFLATFTAPLTEEVVYRGILYSAFQRTIGVPAAVVFVTLIFAAVHFYQYWGSPSTIFLIYFLSLVLTLVRVVSKNLLPCIILHTLINGVQSIALVVQSFAPPVEESAPAQAAVIIHSLFY